LTLTTPLPIGATSLTAKAIGAAQIDALLLIPLISSVRIGDATLLASVDTHPRTVSVAGRQAYTYDASGRLVAQGNPARAVVRPGGFTVVLG
jgi:YD repeat-containing protein